MPLTAYRWLLFVKLAAALVYAGGTLASLLSSSLPERRRAVHRVASPALLVVWLSGYALAEAQGLSLAELWLFGGLCGSFVSLTALTISLHVTHRALVGAVACAALGLVLSLMVFRPTWESLP